MFKAAKEATKYIGHPYGQGEEGLDVRKDFIEGYEKAVKDIKELLSAKYEERRLQYVAEHSAYNEGIIDGIYFIQEAVDELTK